jgi:hypothetical protein
MQPSSFSDLTGFEYINDTAAHTGRFNRIYALAATVIASATVAGRTGNTFAAVPLPAGGWIDGQFSSITLTSGTAVAYRSDRG